MSAYTTPPNTRIGHVHLKVSDLERSLAFYRDAFGFELQQRYGAPAASAPAGGSPPAPRPPLHRDAFGFRAQPRHRPPAPFVSAGGYHHHIGLSTWTQ